MKVNAELRIVDSPVDNLAAHRLKALGHNRNVSDLRRPCGQHGTIGGIENGIHRNLTVDPTENIIWKLARTP